METPPTIKVWDTVYGYPVDCPCTNVPCDFIPEKTDMSGSDAGIKNIIENETLTILRQLGLL